MVADNTSKSPKQEQDDVSKEQQGGQCESICTKENIKKAWILMALRKTKQNDWNKLVND